MIVVRGIATKRLNVLYAVSLATAPSPARSPACACAAASRAKECGPRSVSGPAVLPF